MRADAQANREAIIIAAKELFQAQGVTVAYRTIATRAEVGVATIHRHFPERLDLVAAVMDHVFDGVMAAIASHEEQWAVDPWRAWSLTVHEIVELRIAAVGEGVLQYITSEIGRSEYLDAMKARNLGKLESFLARASYHGFVHRDLEPQQFQFGMMVISRPLPPPAEAIYAGNRDWLVDTYLDGLRVQASVES